MIQKYLLVGLIGVICLTGIGSAQEENGSVTEANEPEHIFVLQDVQKRLKSLLPDPVQMGGQFTGESVFYSENLWEYIDGAAESFHAYGFVALIHQDYQIDDSEVTVDIYDMGHLNRAFGMYASERSPDYRFLDIGAEGYGDEFGLNFYQDRYYIKLSIFSEADITLPLLQQFAEDLSKTIQTGKNLPEIFSRFPIENRIGHSEQYMHTEPLGHAFLSPVFSAQYQIGEEVCTLLISVPKSEAEAIHQSEKLGDHFKQTGKIEKIPEVNASAFRAISVYQTETIVVPHNHFVFILEDPPSNGMLFLQKAMECIDKK
jgi:hypothetical protein